jgi:hypothetical protein
VTSWANISFISGWVNFTVTTKKFLFQPGCNYLHSRAKRRKEWMENIAWIRRKEQNTTVYLTDSLSASRKYTEEHCYTVSVKMSCIVYKHHSAFKYFLKYRLFLLGLFLYEKARISSYVWFLSFSHLLLIRTIPISKTKRSYEMLEVLDTAEEN